MPFEHVDTHAFIMDLQRANAYTDFKRYTFPVIYKPTDRKFGDVSLLLTQHSHMYIIPL